MVATGMATKAETETVRIRKCTGRALRSAAYGKPLECASIAEFLRMVERGNLKAIKLWQVAAKQLEGES